MHIRGPLLGNFEENILNQRLQPIRRVEGYRAKLKASSRSFETKQLEAELEVSFFAAGGECSFPYLCRTHLEAGDFRIPKRGTLQVALLNPHGTVVRLFLLAYDLSDMPANSQTFLRQRTVLLPSKRVQYLIQFNIVSSKSARIYLHKDLKIFIAKRVDLQTADEQRRHLLSTCRMSNSNSSSSEANGCDTATCVRGEESYDEMPQNPRYFAR